MAERGGPTTQSGIHYQNEVAALYLCELLGGRETSTGKVVVAVRVEGCEAVDDIEVQYGDGTRLFVQAKEKIQPGKKWSQMWQTFATIRFSDKFSIGDRLQLAIGVHTEPTLALREAAMRAAGARDEEEWWRRLGTKEESAANAIGELVLDEHRTRAHLFELFETVEVIQRDPARLGEIAAGLLPERTPVSQARVFDVLTSLVPENARIRKEFTRDALLEQLRLRDVELIPAYDAEDAVRSASVSLAGWPQTLSDGTWLERPLLSQLHERLRGGTEKPVVVLGPPGCGKSALLARMVAELESIGVRVLGLKADGLPREVATRGELQVALDLPDDPVEMVRALARLGRAALVVDQLDALSDLMDVHTRRLDVLLRLVADVARMPNVVVLLSARAVDFHHDVRFAMLQADEVQLEPLPVDVVRLVLREREIDPAGFSVDSLKLLQFPQWLRWYLSLRPAQSAVANDFALLQELWRVRVIPLGSECEQLTVDLAEQMADREELWLAEAGFAAQVHHIERLVAADVLKRETTPTPRIGFAHQTLFEFAHVRQFAERDDALMEHVARKGDSLFVRPTVSSALSYLRTVHQRRYLQAVRGLLKARPHLRRFTLEYLGRVQQPTDEEAALMLPLLLTRDDAVVLQAMCGNEGWFDRLRDGWLPGVMGQDDPWPAVRILTAAIKFARCDVLQLLQHWAHDDRRHDALFQTLLHFDSWDDASCNLVLKLVEHGQVADSWLSMLLSQMKTDPKLALRVLRRRLELESMRVHHGHGAEEMPAPKDASQHLFDLGKSFDAVDHLARHAPSAFVQELWPWFREVIERAPLISAGATYTRTSSVQWDMRGETGEFASSMVNAIERWAPHDPDGFLQFVSQEKTSGRMAVHAFLIEGLCAIADDRPADVVEYLLGDARRLTVGKLDAEASADLLSAVAHRVSAEERAALEREISKLAPHSWSAEDSAETRRARLAWNIELRRQLTDCLSPTNPKREPRRKARNFGFRGVPPRMSSTQMSKASDEAIEGLFQRITLELDAGSTDDHAVYAVSNELKELAKAEPDRGKSLLDRFVAAANEPAVAGIVEGLAAAEVDVAKIVLDCESRGLSSSAYRQRVAYALRQQATRAGGLDSAVCDLLRSWLTDSPSDEEPITNSEGTSRKGESSVLWTMGFDEPTLPRGNFPVLNAITAGLLARTPAATDAWMDVLEEHLTRREDFRVWRALAHELKFIRGCGSADRATAFLDDLFAKYPRVRDSLAGARLIASLCVWVAQDQLQSWLASMRSGAWHRGQQAFGEIVMFRSTFSEPEDWAVKLIHEMIKPETVHSDDVVGVAHACAHVWRDLRCRGPVTEVMLQLLRSPNEAVSRTLVRGFPTEPLIDGHTGRLLQALIDAPEVVAHRATLFVKSLARLVSAMPDRIVALLKIIIRTIEDGTCVGKDVAEGPELVDLTMTLQRMSTHRHVGLDLFERLIELGCYGVSQALEEFQPRIGAQQPVGTR